MKYIYILIVLVVAALTLGCIENKPAESTGTDISPVQTSASPMGTAAPAIEDPFGTDTDVAALDSMLADSTMDISLSESI